MSTLLDEVRESLEPSPEVVSVMAGSKPAAVLALDIGTSGVRASLFDEKGSEIDGATVRLQSRRSYGDDLALTDAEACFELVAETIDELFDRPLQSPTRINLIAVSCFWHSLVGVDADGSATTPVYGWADTRAASAAKQLRSQFNETEVHARTGCRFHSSYWPAKLLSLRAEEPQTFGRSDRWLSFGEYFVLRLFGETAASISMASGTGLLNQRTMEWDSELLEGLGLTPQSLPKVACENQIFQGMARQYTARWPQLSEARLFAPIGDGAANTIGSGCTTRDRVALMIGTSGAMRVLFEGEPPAELPPSLWCYRADERKVVVGGALSDGGGLFRWIRETMLTTDNSESIEAALEALEPDGHGLTVLPFWAGERSTGWSAQARGAILGLTIHTEPIEILRAAMEAIGYRFALIAKDLEPFAPGAAIIASGTAMRSSPVWVQIIADVLGRPVTLSASPEASARGAALLALEATGRIKSIEGFPVEEGTFTPNMSHHERYQRGLERQIRYYEKFVDDH